MDKILIVDGSNLLFQMFYGMPAQILNTQGRPIQGTVGFIGALLRVIRRIRPTHVAVVFDGECHNPRKDLCEDYKANRDYDKPQEDLPFCQLPDIYNALSYLGICHRETDCCEADDWIAGYARRYGGSHEMVILSQDSDFFQLIGDHVRILRYRGDNSVLCDREWLRGKLGIEAEQYADFKSLTGDTADNIKGAPKVGPITAAKLLRQFGTLENALANLEAVPKPSIRASLSECGPRLGLNKLLIRLDGTEALPFSLEEMAWQDPGGSSYQVLTAIGIR